MSHFNRLREYNNSRFGKEIPRKLTRKEFESIPFLDLEGGIGDRKSLDESENIDYLHTRIVPNE